LGKIKKDKSKKESKVDNEKRKAAKVEANKTRVTSSSAPLSPAAFLTLSFESRWAPGNAFRNAF
jgi:hypothetical protein